MRSRGILIDTQFKAREIDRERLLERSPGRERGRGRAWQQEESTEPMGCKNTPELWRKEEEERTKQGAKLQSRL
jgi:hypothetical protein